jgi:hypothetical protein
MWKNRLRARWLTRENSLRYFVWVIKERDKVAKSFNGRHGQEVQGPVIKKQAQELKDIIAKANLTKQDHYERLHKQVLNTNNKRSFMRISQGSTHS